jgi:hypothetical protein
VIPIRSTDSSFDCKTGAIELRGFAGNTAGLAARRCTGFRRALAQPLGKHARESTTTTAIARASTARRINGNS